MPTDLADGIQNSKTIDEINSPLINDWQFIRDLKRLKELRSFLIQEAINLNPSDSGTLSFGNLNQLRYRIDGRAPTREEWTVVELHTQTLFALLNEPLRKKFLLGEIPNWMTTLPIGLVGIAVAALLCEIVLLFTLHGTSSSQVGFTTLFYLVWLMSLGALGSVAFIGMNALSVQEDVTFDLSNHKLMLLRITLGALFGMVLSLPFGIDVFLKFVVSFSEPGGNKDAPTKLTAQAILLLLPFILGFSTSLVIMILNRLVDAVQAFFGKTGTGEIGKLSSSMSEPRSLARGALAVVSKPPSY